MATPAGDSIPQVDTAAVNGLIQGGSWEVAPGVRAHALTYSFSVETDLGPDIGWTPALQNAVRGAFAAWSAVANLTFQEVDGGVDVDSSPAQIALVPTGDLLGQATEGQLIAIGYFPDPVAVDALIGETGRAESPNAEGDVYFDSATAPFDFVSPGGVGLTVFLHEIGHTLGLKHPYDDGHNGRPTISTDASVTVMALGAPGSVISSPATGNASTPLVDDIRAIQYIYGANQTYHTGNDVYQLRADGVRRAIWDAGGTDTFDATAAPIGLTIDLAEGASVDILSKSSVSIAYGVTIENAIGSAFADRITGNAAANRLEGRAGNDTLDGGAGADTLDGGAGSDFYVLRNTGNVMIEAANSGVDTIEAHVALGLLPANFENLVLLASGNLDVTGNALANRISGNFDDNRLDGGAGADTLEGGFGNDTYIVDNAGDRVTELLDTGSIDRVESSVSFTLGANLEQLALTESSDVNGTGNGVDNVLTGNSGANVLDGGAGADTLAGGAGDDTYIVDNAGDVVTEFSGQGRDTIVTPFETVLSTPFENLFLSGTGNVNATGNAANNVLHGNVGNNVLDGGTGMDTMDGGAGNDTYVIDRLLEQGVISDSGGVDTVISGAQYTGLASGLENLTLTGNAWYGVGNDGANAIVGTSGANVLQGGAGNDTLSGGGGADVLIGGDGADRFVFDTPLAAGNVDVVIDFSATANDRIVLDNDVFGALATLGTLAPAGFFAAAGAHEAANASEHIVLDTTSGALYYDADGAGGAAAVQIALIIGTAGITAANFEIVH